MATTGPHAHAYVINFEAELVNRFGKSFTLADELRFPVFVQALTPAGVEAHNKVRKQLPISARNYITEFETNLDPASRAPKSSSTGFSSRQSMDPRPTPTWQSPSLVRTT